MAGEKTFEEGKEVDQGVKTQAMREASLLQKVEGNENVVSFLGATVFNGGTIAVFMEKMEESLDTFCARNKVASSSSDLVRDIVFQIGNGVSHIHSRGVMHRDIKPSNCLLSSSLSSSSRLRACLCDFGSARAFFEEEEESGRTYTRLPGTLCFSSPEMLIGSRYGFRTDLWSFGVLCAFLHSETRSYFWNGETWEDVLLNVLSDLGDVDKSLERSVPNLFEFWSDHKDRSRREEETSGNGIPPHLPFYVYSFLQYPPLSRPAPIPFLESHFFFSGRIK
jgi:serine/threonine protein kinase